MTTQKNILSWDEYFMGLAHLSALRSKDPNTKVGAAIVDDNHRVVSVGYNGFPKGCSDEVFPWGRDGDTLDSKYAFVVHAELNAILNSKWPVAGFMYPYSHAMNVQKQLYNLEFIALSMNLISIMV